MHGDHSVIGEQTGFRDTFAGFGTALCVALGPLARAASLGRSTTRHCGDANRCRLNGRASSIGSYQGGRGLAIKKFGRVDTGAAAFTGEQSVVSARAVALPGARCGTAAAITSIARIQGKHGEEEIPPIACAKKKTARFRFPRKANS